MTQSLQLQQKNDTLLTLFVEGAKHYRNQERITSDAELYGNTGHANTEDLCVDYLHSQSSVRPKTHIYEEIFTRVVDVY